MAFQGKSPRFEFLYLISLIFLLVILSLTAPINFAIYIIVYIVSCFFPNYGKFISCTDVLLDEDLVNSIPQTSIVTSLTIQGDLSLDKLKSTFTENVLNLTSKANPHKLRYPELKQHLTTFICFRVWKNDTSFHIRNHIVEKIWNGANLGTIHQEYLNKPYQKERSPWELILIRNVSLDEDSEKGPISVLVFRVPHIMGDAKSVLKLLVEGLGNKKLKTTCPQFVHETRLDRLRLIIYFPWNFVFESLKIFRLLSSSFNHPWKAQYSFIKSSFNTNKTLVSFSSKISLSGLKQVAKRYDVKTSAVLISIIAGAIRRICGKNWNEQVAIGYPLPRPGHPESLTNHMYGSLLVLPTDQQCEFKRLQKCDQAFTEMKDEHQGIYADVGVLLAGLQIYPISRLFFNAFGPIGITNNAGEEEGFSVGNAECIDYHMSVGLQRGVQGVLFCTISYKDGLRIGVVAKESILSDNVVQILARHIDTELQLLL